MKRAELLRRSSPAATDVASLVPRGKVRAFIQLTSAQARRIWLHAQRLDVTEPFGSGPKATPAAVAHLGYLQIDTIYVIERCHHHILYTRIPSYRREHLHQAQSIGKSFWCSAGTGSAGGRRMSTASGWKRPCTSYEQFQLCRS